MLTYVAIGLVAAVLVLAIYVRMAPSDPKVWHTPNLPVMEPGQYPSLGGYVDQTLYETGGADALARLDAIIRATPRTTVLAGSVQEGKITYVTRTALWGFPDYTTVTLARLPDSEKSSLQVHGRLRFGKGDLGVNRARIEGWLAQLQQDMPSQ